MKLAERAGDFLAQQGWPVCRRRSPVSGSIYLETVLDGITLVMRVSDHPPGGARHRPAEIELGPWEGADCIEPKRAVDIARAFFASRGVPLRRDGPPARTPSGRDDPRQRA